MHRRTLLKGALLFSSVKAWAAVIPSDDRSNNSLENLYASAYTHVDGSDHFALFDETGTMHWSAPLPERAHAPVFHPNHAIVGIVARRPGYFLDLYNLAYAEKMLRIEPSQEHHFYGHAVFSADGNALITPENHYPSGQGKIVVRDWKNNSITHEFPSYGIGPHEVHLLNDDILVVANGGLHTHPDNDRKILNLDTMQPNLAFISLTTGELLNKLELPAKWRQLSIRHLDVNPSGKVAMGFQYQGPLTDNVPLVGSASIDSDAITLIEMPMEIKQRFKQYCGSVTFDKSGSVLAISSPRGGIVAYWDTKSNGYFEHSNYRDVCGVSPTSEPHQFLLTTGQGKRVLFNPLNGDKENLASIADFHWDNHIHHIKI